MVNVVLYFFHVVFFVYIVYTRFKNESLSEAALNAALIIILFTVGYSIFDFITKFIIIEEGFGRDFTRDTLNLTLLSIAEFFFYKNYYFNKTTSDEKEK